MRYALLITAGLLVASCSKAPAPVATVTPVAVVSPASVISPTPSATETAVPLGNPELPSDASSFLVELSVWTSDDASKYPWWTQSGISDNGIRAFSSELEPEDVESRLVSFLESDSRVSVADSPGFFPVQDSRMALFAKPDDSYSVAALVSPVGQPPQAWLTLGLPPIDWTTSAAALEGKKSLVVIFSGYGTADYLQTQASSASLTASPSPSPEISESPSSSPSP